MKRTAFVLVAILALAVFAQAVLALPVEITSPKAGQVVKQSVKLTAIKDRPDEGYVSFFVDDMFVAALTQPFSINWDVKEFVAVAERLRDEYRSGERVGSPVTVPAIDGEHTVRVVAYDNTGEVTGEDTLTFTVTNSIKLEGDPAVRLKYGFELLQESIYDIDTNLALEVAGPAAISSKGKSFEKLRDIVTRSQGAEGGMIYRKSLQGWKQQMGSARLLDDAGKSLTFNMDLVGVQEFVRGDDFKPFICSPYVPLPGKPVRVKESWHGKIPVSIEGQQFDLTGTSTLQNLEWESGYKCAKIVSTFSGGAQVPAEVGGQLAMVKGDISGTKTTWLDYGTGRIIKVTQALTGKATVTSAQLQEALSAMLGTGRSSAPGAAGQGAQQRMPGTGTSGMAPMMAPMMSMPGMGSMTGGPPSPMMAAGMMGATGGMAPGGMPGMMPPSPTMASGMMMPGGGPMMMPGAGGGGWSGGGVTPGSSGMFQQQQQPAVPLDINYIADSVLVLGTLESE